MRYAWLIWSLILLGIWAVVYARLRSAESRREMLWVSAWTAVFGLSEPIFVPAYWLPPSLFDLAARTGFDMESLLFSFGIGGLAVALYEWLFRVRHERIGDSERLHGRHRLHAAALVSAPLAFLLLTILVHPNPIYAATFAFVVGGVATIACRPDLLTKMAVSAGVFLALYFVYFLSLVLVFPGYVEAVWNLKALSGVLVAGIPAEELMFAVSFGFYWSSLHEHLRWVAVSRRRRGARQARRHWVPGSGVTDGRG